jgi:hypothetical protein
LSYAALAPLWWKVLSAVVFLGAVVWEEEEEEEEEKEEEEGRRLAPRAVVSLAVVPAIVPGGQGDSRAVVSSTVAPVVVPGGRGDSPEWRWAVLLGASPIAGWCAGRFVA